MPLISLNNKWEFKEEARNWYNYFLLLAYIHVRPLTAVIFKILPFEKEDFLHVNFHFITSAI